MGEMERKTEKTSTAARRLCRFLRHGEAGTDRLGPAGPRRDGPGRGGTGAAHHTAQAPVQRLFNFCLSTFTSLKTAGEGWEALSCPQTRSAPELRLPETGSNFTGVALGPRLSLPAPPLLSLLP